MEEERADKKLRGRLLNFGHPFTTLQYGLIALGADALRAAMEPLADAVQRGTPLDQTLKHLVQTASALSLDLDFDFVLEPELLGVPLGTAIVRGPNIELDLGPALTGLPTRRRSELVFGLEPRGEGIKGLAGGSIAPMVLLGDRFSSYAELFGGFEVGEYSSSERSSGFDRDVQAAFEAWWNAAAPCRDVAMVFDLVGEVVEKLMHLDDEILALSEVALGVAQLPMAALAQFLLAGISFWTWCRIRRWCTCETRS